MTPRRSFDVMMTLLLRRVSAGTDIRKSGSSFENSVSDKMCEIQQSTVYCVASDSDI